MGTFVVEKKHEKLEFFCKSRDTTPQQEKW
jgi:hypothetical protein